MANLVPVYINVEDLDKVKDIFLKLGFKNFILQEWKKDQIFGLAKDVNPEEILKLTGDQKAADTYPSCQWHLRGYNDGKLEMEVEIHRFDLRHLWSTYPSVHNEIGYVLAHHRIHYRIGSITGPIDSIESLKDFPKEGEIDWMSLLAIFGLGFAMVALVNRGN